jgi:hypothetical protein
VFQTRDEAHLACKALRGMKVCGQEVSLQITRNADQTPSGVHVDGTSATANPALLKCSTNLLPKGTKDIGEAGSSVVGGSLARGTLYVGNLPYEATEQEIEQLFRRFHP